MKSGAGDLAARLKCILDGLKDVIAAHDPVEVAVEKVFVSANPQSTLALGQARGTAICAAVLAGLPVSEYTALQVKQSVVGNGHAAEQVQHGEAPALAPRRSRARRGRRARVRDLPRARKASVQFLPGLSGSGRASRLIGRLSAGWRPSSRRRCSSTCGGLRARRADEHFLQSAGDRRTGKPVHAPRGAGGRAYPLRVCHARGAHGVPAAHPHLRRRRAHRARRAVGLVGELAEPAGRHRFTRVPGIGKKTAERLLLELKGKLAEPAAAAGGQQASDVVNALVALGYSDKH